MNNGCPERQALVFDLGGTYLRCGIWDPCAGVSSLRRSRIDNFLNSGCLNTVWDNLLRHIEDYTLSVSQSVPLEAPIVISFPGPIDKQHKILGAPTFLGQADTVPDLADSLQQRTGRKTYVLNDISAAAWHLSLTAGTSRFLVVTVSSGIGSKIFDASHPLGVMDAPAWAGEIGHLVVDESPEAPWCDCGERGHLGALSSGRGIERAARLYARENPGEFSRSSCATRFGATASTVDNEAHLVPAARLGDEWSLNVIRHATRPLARVILAIVVAAGIERVIVIGGFALSLGPVYLRILREEVAANCRYGILRHKVDSLLELGSGCEDACLLGAGAYAQRMMEGCL